MASLDPSKYYSPARKCRNGHFALRRISDDVCVDCERARLDRWKEKNTEHIRDRGRRQAAKNPAARRERERARYAADPDKFIKKQKNFYAANSEAVRARRRDYHYATYTDPDVRERAQQRTRQWARDNPAKAKVNARNAKAKRRHVPGTHTADDVSAIFKMQKGKCAYCRHKLLKYEVDHIVAVSKGGTNDRKNIQLTCSPCNRAKSARDPEFHARTLGMLL